MDEEEARQWRGLRAAAVIVDADVMVSTSASEACGCVGAGLAAAAAAAGGGFGWHVTRRSGGGAGSSRRERRMPLDRACADGTTAFLAAITASRMGDDAGSEPASESRAAAVPHALAATLGSPEWEEAAASSRGIDAARDTPLVVAVIASRAVLAGVAGNRLHDSMIGKLRADGAKLILIVADEPVSLPAEIQQTTTTTTAIHSECHGNKRAEAEKTKGNTVDTIRSLRHAFPDATLVSLEAFASSFAPFSVHVALALSNDDDDDARPNRCGNGGSIDDGPAEAMQTSMRSGARTGINTEKTQHVVIRSGHGILLGRFIVHGDRRILNSAMAKRDRVTAGSNGGHGVETTTWRLRATILVSDMGLPGGEPCFLSCTHSCDGDQSAECSECASHLAEHTGVVTFLATLAASQRAAVLESDDSGSFSILETASGMTAVMRKISAVELQDFIGATSRKPCVRHESQSTVAAAGTERPPRRSSGRADKVLKFMSRNSKFTSRLLLSNVYDTMFMRPDVPIDSGAQTSHAGRKPGKAAHSDPSKLDVSDLQRVKRVRKLLLREACSMSRVIDSVPTCGVETFNAVVGADLAQSTSFLTNLRVALGSTSPSSSSSQGHDTKTKLSLESALASMLESPYVRGEADQSNEDTLEGQPRRTNVRTDADPVDVAHRVDGSLHKDGQNAKDMHNVQSFSFRAQLEHARGCALESGSELDVETCLKDWYRNLLTSKTSDAHEGTDLPFLADALVAGLATVSDVLSHVDARDVATLLERHLMLPKGDLAKRYHGAGGDDDGLPSLLKLREYTMQIVLRLHAGKIRILSSSRRESPNARRHRAGSDAAAAGNDGSGENARHVDLAATTTATKRAPVRGKFKDPLPKSMRRDIVSMVGALSFDLKPTGSDMREFCLRVLYERFRDTLPVTMEKVLVALGLELPNLQLPERQNPSQAREGIRDGARTAGEKFGGSALGSTAHEQQQIASQSGILTLPSSTDGANGTQGGGVSGTAAAVQHRHYTSFRNASNLRRAVTLRVTKKTRDTSAADASMRERDTDGGEMSLQRTGSAPITVGTGAGGSGTATATIAHGGGGEPKSRRERRKARGGLQRRSRAGGTSQSRRRDFVGPTPEKQVKRVRHEVVKETPACKVQNMRKALDDLKAQRILFGSNI